MVPSAALCRSQEALHRGRASEAQLENVRAIATVAANAWGHEALLAESREERRDRTARFREDSARAAMQKAWIDRAGQPE